MTLDPVTWEKYEAFLMHLNNFNNRIKFIDIDDTMIIRIRKYLTEQKGRKGKLEPATIKSYFDKFRVVLTHAAKKDHLLDTRTVEQFFNDNIIIVPRRREGLHLEIEEIQALRKLEFDPKDRSLEPDRDLFLFQIYTGLYYSDLLVLKKTQLYRDIEYGSYIIGERDKKETRPLSRYISSHILHKCLKNMQTPTLIPNYYSERMFLSKYKLTTGI